MRNIDTVATTKRLVRFLRETVVRAGFSQVVVAVSGGIDSATSVSLAVKALRKDHVHALLLPYRDWHGTATTDARKLLQQLEIPEKHIHKIDISLIADTAAKSLNLETGSSKLDRMRLGNIMARARMVVLFDFAKKLPALVLGTENKSEHYLGYFTRFGDEASDIEPLRQLYKTEVYEVAKHLGMPEEIINKAPTAGLWQGQTDEGQFGFTYREADEVLCGLYEANLTAEQLEKQGIKLTTIKKVTAWVEDVSFKHHLPKLGPEPIYL